MEFNINKIRRKVQELVSLIQPPDEKLNYFYSFLDKKSYQSCDIEDFINFLSQSIIDEKFTIPIATCFEDCLLLLIGNALENNNNNFNKEIDIIKYQWKCIALSKLMHLSLCVKRYALSYFLNKPPPFLTHHEGLVSKKPKIIIDKRPDTLLLIKCCFYLLKSNTSFFKDLWNWSEFVLNYMNCFNDENTLLKVYANHIIAMLTNMNSSALHKLNEKIPEEILIEFDDEQASLRLLNIPIPSENSLVVVPDYNIYTSESFLSFVTNVEGVILPVFNKDNYEYYRKAESIQESIVRVESTRVNLRNIALGVTSGRAICLSGPVGCGKTTLVEYLARMTGRIALGKQNDEDNQTFFISNVKNKTKKNIQQISKTNKRSALIEDETIDSIEENVELRQTTCNGFLRIQLGDQTDSKMLLGQYHCTDVPGEFIWLPGVLTQAVMNGYWLLLEDLDCATTDSFTVLNSLFENNFLSVPGFRDYVKITPGFQLFVTVRTHKYSLTNSSQKALFSLLEKHLYPVNVLPLTRNELCQMIELKYSKLANIANRIVDVFLTFSSGDHDVTDNIRQQKIHSKANSEDEFLQLPHENVNLVSVINSGRSVSTRDLIKLCQRSNPNFSTTNAECAYFVFQNAVDVFCSYLPNSKEKTKLIISIGAKLGIIQSRCEYFANELKPDVYVDNERIKVGRAELYTRSASPHEKNCIPLRERMIGEQSSKRIKLCNEDEKLIRKFSTKRITSSVTFSFTRLATCLLERIAICVANAEPVLLVGETGVGKTSCVQYLAARTEHKLVVVNMNNQSDVSDLVGGFKPVDLSYVIAPLRTEFELLFRQTFNQSKNESFLTKFSICYNQGNFSVIVKLMLKIINNVFEKSERNELREKDLLLLPRWMALKMKLQKLNSQLNKSLNISFAFIPGSLVNCIKNGDWILLDEINLASTETLECLSTILEPDGSVVLLEQGDFTPVKRHPDFRIFSCMNPNTDIGKKDLPVGIRNRFTEFFVDEAETEADLSLLITDYLSVTGIQRKSVMNIVKLYKRLKSLAKLELNDGLGNRPVYSLRTLCRSLIICARNLCGSIERNLYESFCLSFLTQLDSQSHNVVQHLIKETLLSNAKATLQQSIPKPGDGYLNFQGYWIQKGPKELQECSNYILTESVKENLRDLARIISIGKLPILLQGPTSAGKTSLIDYVARRSGNYCLRINNHEHTDLQEYIGTYTNDISGKLIFKEGVLIQAMRNGYWIILDELNLASTEILEALNRVLDDNREIFIPETQTVVKAHSNFMLFATQNPPGLYGGRKTLSRAFKNRFIELHFSEIPRKELEIILEKKCLIPASYAQRMVACMVDLQKNRKSTSKNTFTLRDLFRWGIRYTLADKKLLSDSKYDWNQHLVEEGYLVLSAKVRTEIELEIIEETLYKNFKKHINLSRLFNVSTEEPKSLVTKDIIDEIKNFKSRTDIVWTRNMTRMAVLIAKALQFNEPVLLVGPTGCGKTTVCQLLAAIRNVDLRILNCHMHTEGADFLGGLRPCRHSDNASKKMFEWADGPLIQSMQEGSYFMADEISLAEDSVLERLNCILEPERTVLLAEKCGTHFAEDLLEDITEELVIQAKPGFQFLATMNPGGDFGKKELSPALRNRFTEIWCQPSDCRDDLIEIANNCIKDQLKNSDTAKSLLPKIASYIVEVVLYMKKLIEKFKFSIRDILAMANYMVTNTTLSFPEKAIFGLEIVFLDALEMNLHESPEKIEALKNQIIEYAIQQAYVIMNEKFSLSELLSKKGTVVEFNSNNTFGIKPFFIKINNTTNGSKFNMGKSFLFDAPTTKCNLFRLLSALSLNKPILLEGPPGVGKTSIVENLARVIGYNIVRINLCEHTDLADLFGTDLPAEDNITNLTLENNRKKLQIGSFQWRDGPLLAALKTENSWILLDEMNLAPQSVLEGLNAILDHRGEVYIPELNKTFILNKRIRIFASQNPLKQGGGRKGLPQSFLNRFTKVYVRKLTTEDLLHVIEGIYNNYFNELRDKFVRLLPSQNFASNNLFDIYNELINQKEEIPPLENMEKSDQNNLFYAEFDLPLRMVRFSEILDNGISNMEFGYRGGPYEINLRDILFWCDLLLSPQTGFLVKNDGFIENFENFLQTLYERMKLAYYQRMRNENDKRFIRNAFEKIFQCESDYFNSLSEDIGIYWTNEKIYFNDIILDRSTQPFRFQKSFENLPLLLETQCETLKNLVECVHMKKPVLLCGSTDTGKTKLIDTLCCLSNKMCYLDNIDDTVTGNFQQIDLNRHLEEMTYQVECVYLKLIQKAFLDKSTPNQLIIELLDYWNTYSVLRNHKTEFKSNSFISEELGNYRRRLDKLNSVTEVVINCLKFFNNQQDTEKLHTIQNMLKLLKLYVENVDSLNTGGCFEWVDSKIVKSLKDGHYILLEHVNLCSLAVLDRLNSVFEPNGCLMLSEKGVIDGEKAEVVEKSKNFRAFLTLDPKNGEISRAMRNRCVEIFLNNGILNLDDKRKLLFNEGVHDINVINCIINIHDSITNLTEVNNFSVSHLTQTGFLCISYHRIGYKMERAIYISAMEVYVYSATTDLIGYGLNYYQNKLREIVVTETEKFGKIENTYQKDYLRDIVLNCSSLNEIKLIKLQIVPLKIILDNLLEPSQVKVSLSQILSDFESINMDNINLNDFVKYLIYMEYEMSSMNDLRFRYLQLEKCLNNDNNLLELSKILYKCIDNLNEDFKCIPPSLPLNLKLYPRIRDYNTKCLDNIKDRELCLSSLLIIHMLLKDIPKEPITKLSCISVLTYSQAVAKKSLNDKLNNTFVQYLSEFLFHLENLLKTKTIKANINMDSYTQLITSILWFNRMLNVSSSNIYINNEFNTDLVDKLILHFKWLNKHLIRLICKLIPNIETISPELHDCLVKVNKYIRSNKHPLDLRRKVYAKHLVEFQPFYQEEQVEIFMKTQKLDQLLRLIPVYGNFAPEDMIKKVAIRNSENFRKANAVISKNYNMINFNKISEITLEHRYGKFIPEDIKFKLQHLLTSFVNNKTINDKISSDDLKILEYELSNISCLMEKTQQMPHEIELGLQAVREFFLLKFLISSIENSSFCDKFSLNYEYKENTFYLNSCTKLLLNIYKLPQYQDYRNFWFNLCNYMNRIYTLNEFQELLAYLNGGYKHLSVLNKFILNLIQKLQLENIKYLDCIQIGASRDVTTTMNMYKGPTFINIISSTVFVDEFGVFKSVPLCDVDIWRNSLNELCEVIWSNSVLATITHNIQWNNYLKSQQNAKRLLLEVKYVEMFCHSEDNMNKTDFAHCFKNLTIKLEEYLAQCPANFSSKSDSIENQNILYKSSLTNTLIGCIELCLITFTPLIDPVEKNRLKCIYISEDIYCLNNLKLAYDFTRITMKYKHLGEEIYKAINERINLLNEIQIKHEKRVALRPDKCLYSSLVKDITHFLRTNCNPEMFLALIKNIELVWVHLFENKNSEYLEEHLESCAEVINKLNLWIANSQKFVHHTLHSYSLYYQDFIQPLQCSIDQLRFGLEGLITILSQVKNSIVKNENGTHTNINANNRLHHVLQNIVEFPSSKMLNIFNVNSTKDVIKNRCPVFSILNKTPGCETDYFHLLKAKLFELKNRVNISRHINQELFEEFDFTFNIINQVWQQEEELRRKKQKEDESLYLTKTKCEEENEEIQELREINELFPTSIEENFGDFIEEETLERIMKLNGKREHSTNKKQMIVQENDYSFIAKIFINILVRYTQSHYRSISSCSDDTVKMEFIEYFKERLGVFLRLYNYYKSSINDWLEAQCFSSLYFSLVIQKDLLSETSMFHLKQEKTYNFYKDSNIQEIMPCINVLRSIEEKVNEQLELYSEHATLIDIKKVIERICLLPATAPVVRFNIGFQILRKHVALWNNVAHKNNNLKSEEQEIAQYVQKWMRLELQFWRNCLTHIYEKVESYAYKYWFFIYNLIHEFINERKIDFTLSDMKFTKKRFYEHEIVEADSANTTKSFKVEVKDIIIILRQFVESSCYGDFCVRIQLLLAFELYLQNFVNYVPKSNYDFKIEVSELISGLRNLQLYFDQFINDIEEHKKLIKLPIEKKLRELVKIESYNKDLSYISMRNNVTRIHRNLNKFLKEYEQKLKEKITAVFQPKDCTAKDYNFANDKGKDLRYDSKMKYFIVDTKHFVLISKQKLNQPDLTDNNSMNEPQSLLSKIQRFFNTSRNIVKETITNAHYPKYIIALDTLLTLQLERCDQLRNLTVNRTKDRQKQKLEAKQILQQKRKALTDLFKTLAVLGINYKTGLMELSMNDELEDIFVPPFCIKNMLFQVKEKYLQTKMLQLNENLDIYFSKCIFKLKLLRNLMLTPLSDLGPPNIERIKGYAVDLFLLVQNQRRLLASTSRNIYDLRVMLRQLRDLEDINMKDEIEIDESYVNFSKMRDCCQILITILTRICYVFEQFKLFLSRVPINCQNENVLFIGHQQDITFDQNAILRECETILSLSKSTLNNINKESCEFVLKDRLNLYMHSYNRIFALIQDILKNFETSKNEYLPIAKPLIDLSSFINENIQYVFNDENHAKPQCDFENFEEQLEAIIHSILISLQTLFKKYQIKNLTDEEEKIQAKRKILKDDDEIQEQHLKKRLYKDLKDDWNIMNMENLNKQIMNILLIVKLSIPSTEKINYIKKLLNIQPLLEQFSLMAEYFLYQQLGAHKVSIKMLSVMLTVFIEIGTKGFCIPQDLMQDEEGESRKDEREGEGFGLEEGTGENDVSDKIESEDQLDDAKRPEDRADENEKNEPNDCKEEKGIEMSDNFDGNLQDIEKENREDDSGESENEEDISKEIGETGEDANKLDDQIWGKDEDETPEDQEQENEMEDEDGKCNNNEQDTHNDLSSKNDSSKDDNKNDIDNNGLDATNEQNEDKQKHQDKNIDELNDQEADPDQVNPHHNELEEPNEPEDFDLGDLNVNEDNEDDEMQNIEDNPFDIDTMKDNMASSDELLENKENVNDTEEDRESERYSSDESDLNDDDQSNLKNDIYHSDEEDIQNEEDDKDDLNNGEQRRGEVEEEDINGQDKDILEEKCEQSKDKPRKEDNMQAVPEIEVKGSKDQLKAEQCNNEGHQEELFEEQNTGEDNYGIGQAENEKNDGGHQGVAEIKEPVATENNSTDTNNKEKRKQGQTDENRTLGQAEENKIKRLKTIDKVNDEISAENEIELEIEKEIEANEYKHVKEPKTSDKFTLDNATEEQSKKIHPQDGEMDNNDNDDFESDENLNELQEETEEFKNNIDIREISAEKLENKSDNPSKSEQTNENVFTQEHLEVEGGIVETMIVPRNKDTTAHCNKDILVNIDPHVEELSTLKTLELRKMFQEQVSSQQQILTQSDDIEIWQTISNRMAQNARDLCEQLRLILEPTKCTRLKGDYRTGRRINMKKIIPYIASQFRKDKIWLRRTKPAQRDYKITIAIDDSKSMHHNNSKILTLEAISLVSQSLTLLESGSLSVISFGEEPRILLNHGEQFDGPKLVSTLQFSQDKTKIAELLDFVRITNTEAGSIRSDNGIFENLLLILSDGRNIFSEGRSKVKNAMKLARMQRIFLVYIIIDNPDNKNSILDIQTMEMLPDNRINIKSYLEDFPFPYYVIVRDLNQLPIVLSEAMRQWFELVNSEQ